MGSSADGCATHGGDRTILATVTWGYIVWSLLPLVIAIAVSFNAGRSSSSVHLFSLQWWWTDPSDSLLHDPELHSAVIQSLKLSLSTMVIAVPMGVAFALGIDRWRGRAAAGANFVMLLSFVMPEIILGLALFFVFSFLLKFVPLGTPAQILGLVTFQTLVSGHHRARAIAIDREGLRGGGDGPRRDAEAIDPRRAPSACSTRRSSPAPRSCSPTRSTTSSRCDTCPARRPASRCRSRSTASRAANRRRRSTRRRRSCWVPRSWSGSSRTCSTACSPRVSAPAAGLGDLATQF